MKLNGKGPFIVSFSRPLHGLDFFPFHPSSELPGYCQSSADADSFTKQHKEDSCFESFGLISRIASAALWTRGKGSIKG